MSSSKERPEVAYFCMEYGLDPEMRIYAGGLGILAGDILKTAKQYNFPMVGIGILWREGYTKQLIGDNGYPYDSYPRNDYMYQFIEDTDIKVTVQIKGLDIHCKVWKLQKYDNASLYLLDTNLSGNDIKWITGQLYGWFEEERLAQEIVLGIGGIKALRELGIKPDIYHFNEGHAVLAATELIKTRMESGQSFSEAWKEIRERIVFTTHTPVEQGNETHSLEAMEYVGACNGLPSQHMVQIGGRPFNMTAAGLKLSGMANGVSKLHGQTARDMWVDVENKAPIKAITNGIHRETWVDDRIIQAYRSEKSLWDVHNQLKSELIDFVENRRGVRLDSDALLIGFARRAAPYKRADLIFTKPEVIDPYLKQGRIQIVFSGKAHPFDDTGAEIIATLVEKAKQYPESVVFLEDYNMKIGEMLTKGSDIWLNNPRRPLEASGTSGMKAAMNGVLNVSILDGWWPEACQHGVNGWQFGDGYEGENQDQHDLEALYDVLLGEVVPTYYEDRDKWREMMEESIRTTFDRFSAKNMMESYYEDLYNQLGQD